MQKSINASPEAGRAIAPGHGRRHTRDIVELVVGYALIVAVVWTPRPQQRWVYLGAIAWFLVSTVIAFPGWSAMGLRITGFRRSLWVVAIALALGFTATTLASELHTLHQPGSPVQWVKAFGGYTVWAFMQQLLLQGYFLARLLRVVPSKTWAVIIAATVFALVHLPNPILTPVTLLWGLVACFVFLQSRNVYPLAIAHAIFGICVAITVPATMHHNMRVGLGYLTYTPPPNVHLSQIDQSVSTDAWVSAEAPTRR